MSKTPRPTEQAREPVGKLDLPLVIEQLQNQLDDLTATVRAQQDQLAQQSARIAALERS